MRSPATQRRPEHSHIEIHYHYHYYNPKESQAEEEKSEDFKRIRSDDKIRIKVSPYQREDTDSGSSQRSWKKFVKPEFQTTAASELRPSNRTSGFSSSDLLRKPQSQSGNRVSVSEFLLNSTKTPKSKDQSHSTILPNTSSAMLRESLSGESYTKTHSTTSGMFLNPQTRKNRFSKKQEIDVSNARLLQMTERESFSARSQEWKDYRFALLQEECSYLREKFYEHYVRQHHK